MIIASSTVVGCGMLLIQERKLIYSVQQTLLRNAPSYVQVANIHSKESWINSFVALLLYR